MNDPQTHLTAKAQMTVIHSQKTNMALLLLHERRNEQAPPIEEGKQAYHMAVPQHSKPTFLILKEDKDDTYGLLFQNYWKQKQKNKIKQKKKTLTEYIPMLSFVVLC